MADKKGINNNNLKQGNRGLVLRLIATGACNTRIDLAKQTGLTKMSVSNIIGEFIEQKIICEEKTEKIEGQGRNPILLSVSKKAPKVIGLDIHRAECVAVLSDLKLNVIKMVRCPLNEGNSKDLYEIIFRLIDTVKGGMEQTELLGIGVGGLGPVDIEKGMILNPPDFYGLSDLAVTSVLQEHYGLPVYMDSQYNCAAMAEQYYGIGKKLQDFVFVGIMRGIGSGIVSDGSIFRNANGFTSELGHVSVDWNGNPCACGNHGCLETYAGSEVIRERLKAVTGLDKSFQEFCEMAKERACEEIEAVFDDMIQKLACALTGTVNLLNPEAVIIGHEGYFIPERYLRRLEELVNRQKLSGDYRHVKILQSSFRDEAHILGCACTVLNRIFDGKDSFYQADRAFDDRYRRFSERRIIE